VLSVVQTKPTTDGEMEKTVALAASADPAPLLVLQPVTPAAPLLDRLAGRAAPVEPGPAPAKIAAWWDAARRRLPAVKIIPQMHPLWGMP
jgi:hypothetical protein